MLLSFTASCGKDEVEQKSEQGGNQSGQGGQDNQGGGDEQEGSTAPIIVTVDADGNADGGHHFVKIDDTNFYIDDIKYTATKGDLVVTGYNHAFFRGEATIISQLNYVGREMHVIGINEYAFEGCKVLTSVTISEGVTSIGRAAFRGCKGLTSMTIPLSVTSIGESAFSGCTSLTSVTIPSAVTCIESGVFYDCKALTSVAIPSSVTSIEGYAFYGCTGLTSVTIPSSVTSIGGVAFGSCTGLISVIIPSSVTSIGSAVFSGCAGLTSISVSESNIVYDSRSNCNAVIETKSNTLIIGCKNSTIPSSVTSIGEKAFSGCTSLTSVTIPSSVTSIGTYAFHGCTGLTSISVEEGNPIFDSRNNCNAVIETKSNTLIVGCKNSTIPSSVNSIGSNAFDGCTGLTAVTIPSSVNSIGSNAFDGCTGLTAVTIPSSVTIIGYYAFGECTGLTHVYCYAETLPSTNWMAFENTPIADATLHVPASAIEACRNTSPWSGFGTIVAIQ